MAARFCAYCGRPLAANAAFCSSCGAAVGGAPPPAGSAAFSVAPATSGAPTYSPYAPTYPVPGGSQTTFGSADQSALSSVSLAAILGLVGAVLSIVQLFFTSAFSFLGVSSAGSGTSLTLNLTALYLVVAVGAVGIILVLLELWLYRRAFVTLGRQDTRFSTPATMVLVALVALAIIVLVLVALVDVIYQAIVCAGSGNPITSACIDVGTVLGLAAVLGVTAIVAFIGVIGLLIGIWRLGTRYDEAMFKVGAILFIFPVLNFVALILILVAARSASRRLQSVSSPLQFG